MARSNLSNLWLLSIAKKIWTVSMSMERIQDYSNAMEKESRYKTRSSIKKRM